jgi:ABC-type glycerol-3-phosphate transport system substrate-binding protein
MAEGKGPDIFAIKNTWIPLNTGKIAPLPQNEVRNPFSVQTFSDTFFQTAEKDLIQNNAIYGLPLFIDSLALYYNKQLLRDNVPESDKPGRTWEEIKKQSELITKESNTIERYNISGIAFGDTESISRFPDILSALLLDSGVELTNIDNTRSTLAQNKGVHLNNAPKKPFLESLELFTSFGNSLYKNACWSPSVVSRNPKEQEFLPFLEGRVGMIAGYSFTYNLLQKKHEEYRRRGMSVIPFSDIGVAPFPHFVDPEISGKKSALALYFPFTVSKNSEHPKEAWDFLLFLSSKESSQNYISKTGKPPARKDLVEEALKDPLFRTFALQASYAKSFPNTSFFPEEMVFSLLKQGITRALSNKEPLDRIVQSLQNIHQCEIDNYKKRGEEVKECF